ncbi:putative methyltransferase C9orf114 isoform X4 [Nematostella vectensis]|uniref:putative methyltransferase C9orf114 isoform X3 n=1 Tax=Nematostella vectensis TaxID=45351 RepID=UPI0020771AFD|nr:putative methyltransferase C9orf114 isoform X3 [Nematostella vectensis]XP_048587035.1 putative methyltransferase C9orf114 isoform X4 [Nematostella vectensis]
MSRSHSKSRSPYQGLQVVACVGWVLCWVFWKDQGLKRKSKKKDKQKKKKKKNDDSLEVESTIDQKESKRQGKGRDFTVSLALPGSILDNAQSAELRTYLAGQIARAVVVFNVDEVIVFNESRKSLDKSKDGVSNFHSKADANLQLARILQYLECPQYLRKAFFPRHKDLQYAGLLNPLDCPHHMRIDDDMPYREGVVLDRPVGQSGGSLVNAGMRKEVKIDKCIKPGIRVTVKLKPTSKSDPKVFFGNVVSPSAPRADAGLYWGYSVRLAPSFSDVFTESPYPQGYDVMIGTSERGAPVDCLELQPFSHMLIVFGGLKGLEASLESDESLDVSDPSELFHHYLNTCPGQGSRTIRTEEAILISMAALKPVIERTLGWKYTSA